MTSLATSDTVTPAARPFAPRRLAVAGSVALVVNLLVFVAGSAAGASMTVTAGSSQDVGAAAVGVLTAVPITLAGLVTWFVARRLPAFRPVAAWLGLGLALASVAVPLTGADDMETGIALAAMHVVAGAGWFIGLRRVEASASSVV